MTVSLWSPRAAEVVERDGLRVYPGQPETLPALIEDSVETHASALAASELNGRALTYEQLWEESAQAAGALQQRFGVEQGDRVAFVAANCLDLLVGMIGTWRAGAVAVSLNSKYTRVELEKQLRQCSPRVVLADPKSLSKVSGEVPVHVLSNVRSCGGRLEPVPVRAEDPALLMFTSGTTGHSRGALQSHLNLVSTAETWVRCLDLEAGETTVVAAPMFHVTGLNGQSLPMLAVGGSVMIMPRFDARLLVELFVAGEAGFFHAAPTVYALTTGVAGDRRARRLRVGVCGGSFVNRALVDYVRHFAPGVDFRISYGMTETSSPAVLTPPGWIDERPGDAVGVAVPVNDVRIDSEGEILFRGSTVITHYDGAPDESEACFVDGWLRSGDLGTIDGEGFVTVLDRIKDLINRGGEKIASLEVEGVLLEHPGVVEAAVVGAPDDVYGEVPKAFLVGEVRVEELRAFAQERLAKFKVPVEFVFVHELPRNAGGKVLKADLRGELIPPGR
jgi:long-chain acyl-CoA synthetase